MTRCLLPALALLAAGAARGDERLLFLGGEASGSGDYIYAGTVLPLPGHTLGAGLVQRYWADRVTYDYDSGGQRIDAEVFGLEAALGYQWSGADWWTGVYLGVRLTDASLSPDDPTADVRGTQAGLKLQAEAEGPLADAWRAQGIAAYTTATGGYWLRGRLIHPVPGGLVAGPELVVHGNDDYSAWQAGAFIGDIPLGPGTRLLLKGGYRHQDGSGGGYVGVELSSWY